MKFTTFLKLHEEIKSWRIGYGIRNSKHELIKGFNNLKFYQQLQKFKKENEMEKDWKMTNELDVDGVRKFSFFGNDNKLFDIPKNEETPVKRKFGNELFKYFPDDT